MQAQVYSLSTRSSPPPPAAPGPGPNASAINEQAVSSIPEIRLWCGRVGKLTTDPDAEHRVPCGVGNEQRVAVVGQPSRHEGLAEPESLNLQFLLCATIALGEVVLV